VSTHLLYCSNERRLIERVSFADTLLSSEFVWLRSSNMRVNADLLAATDSLERSHRALGDLAVEDVDGESFNFETNLTFSISEVSSRHLRCDRSLFTSSLTLRQASVRERRSSRSRLIRMKEVSSKL